MTAETSSFPDHGAHPVSVAGVRLADIVERAGPFASLFIGPGADLRARAQLALDDVPVPAPHAGSLLASIEESQARSQVAVSDGTDVWRFLLEDPLAFDLARFGDVPSLGPIIEASQVTTPHAVVTIEDDVFAITRFAGVEAGPTLAGGTLVESEEPSILEALDHVVDALEKSGVRLVALVGPVDSLADVQTHLQRKLPFVEQHAYPTDDIDRDLLSIADDVVKDAASLAAERRTYELAHFRQARSAAQTQEGAAAVGSLEAGDAQRLLVHDDLADEPDAGVTRLADRAIVAAIRDGVPITMIPMVPEDRGPRDGLGVIVKGHGSAVASSASDPESAGHVELGV